MTSYTRPSVSSPVLYVLVGLPGSGKTHWIQEQLKTWASDVKHVSTDPYIEQYVKDHDLNWSEGFPLCIDYAITCMMRDVAEARAAGLDIMWDQTSLTMEARKRKLSALPEYYSVAVIVPQPSDLNQRLQARGGQRLITPNIIKTMQTTYIRPTRLEGFHEIWTVDAS